MLRALPRSVPACAGALRPPGPPAARAASAAVRVLPAAPGARAVSTNPPAASPSSVTRTPVSDRTRRKLPVAKAKAKAQASRALLASLGAERQAQADIEIESRHRATPLREAIAWATSDSYDLKALSVSGRLPAGWQMLEDDDAIYIPSWPVSPHSDAPAGPFAFLASPSGQERVPSDKAGEVFVFGSGTYVTWGLNEDQSQNFLQDVIRGQGHGSVEQKPYVHVGDEALEWVWHAEEPTRIVGDVIVLGALPIDAELETSSSHTTSNRWEFWTPLQARLAYSQGLSRSARLSAEEDALDEFLASLENIPEQLEQEGRVPLPRKDVIRKQGALLRLRQRTNLAKDNFFDSPEGHWDNGTLERMLITLSSILCATRRAQSQKKAFLGKQVN